MANKALPSPEVLRQLLRYEPDTGKLFWQERTPDMFPDGRRAKEWRCNLWNSQYAGREAFTAVDTRGHRHGMVWGKLYGAHRIVWAIQTGAWAADEIDHANGNPSDNRWENLRAATRKQNCANRGSRSGSTSRFLGVDRLPDGRWRSQIKPSDGKGFRIGVFASEIEAARAYNEVAARIHGEFARLNEWEQPNATGS